MADSLPYELRAILLHHCSNVSACALTGLARANKAYHEVYKKECSPLEFEWAKNTLEAECGIHRTTALVIAIMPREAELEGVQDLVYAKQLFDREYYVFEDDKKIVQHIKNAIELHLHARKTAMWLITVWLRKEGHDIFDDKMKRIVKKITWKARI